MEKIKSFKISYLYQCCADTIKDLYCNYEEGDSGLLDLLAISCSLILLIRIRIGRKNVILFFLRKTFGVNTLTMEKKLKGKLGNVLEKLPIKMLLKLD